MDCSLPYYKLFVYVDTEDEVLIEKYSEVFKKQQDKVEHFLLNKYGFFDAGIDIFCSEENLAYKSKITKVKTGLKCAMYLVIDNNYCIPSGFYMYPRSSTGVNTPLRLANTVGIIDSGYRGELIGCFDNINSLYDYKIDKYQRLLQICSPQLTYPIYPIMVSSLDDLELYNSCNNDRGDKGFGSTGK